MISNYSTDAVIWDPILLDSAKGSLIYNWVEIEETPEGLATASVLSYLRQTPITFLSSSHCLLNVVKIVNNIYAIFLFVGTIFLGMLRA